MPALNDGDMIVDSNLTGWVAPIDISITVKHSILLGDKEDFPANIIFDPDVIFVKPDTSEPAPVQNIERAAKAELVFRSLIANGLPIEMIPLVEGLLTATKTASNVESLESGFPETMQTLEIIASLRQDGNEELASQIEQALQAVQAIWEAK
jgi:hypothetical protein